MERIRSYQELCQYDLFEERYEYLKLAGAVGRATFGFDRYINQLLYNSREWKRTRRDIIIRDNSCDLGVRDMEIYGDLIVHHINPLSLEDIENNSDRIFDPDNLICAIMSTHNAIHFGDASLLRMLPRERTKGDTTPWKIPIPPHRVY